MRRDREALSGEFFSALARALNFAAHGKPTLFELATAYAFGIANNHPFVDGNKRVAFVASITFPELNGRKFVATEEDAASAFLGLAGGRATGRDLSRWLEARNLKAVRKR